LLPAAIAAIGGLVLAAGVTASPDSSATVRFGNPTAGSKFPPPEGHDASSNAKDNLIPRTVVLSGPGSVTFRIDGFHQPIVYEAGTVPADVDPPPFPPEENIFVTPPAGPLAPGQLDRGPLNEPPTTQSWTTDVFDEPGRYLVICNITPHFAFFNMYGWVIVK
jgi:hypothetical protein